MTQRWKLVQGLAGNLRQAAGKWGREMRSICGAQPGVLPPALHSWRVTNLQPRILRRWLLSHNDKVTTDAPRFCSTQ